MKISVIGFGYIGSVIGAVLSNKGHKSEGDTPIGVWDFKCLT